VCQEERNPSLNQWYDSAAASLGAAGQVHGRLTGSRGPAASRPRYDVAAGTTKALFILIRSDRDGGRVDGRFGDFFVAPDLRPRDGAFFPVFGDGNTVTAIVVASIGIWLFHFMILRSLSHPTRVYPRWAFDIAEVGWGRLR
jgi:hypothetical protein